MTTATAATTIRLATMDDMAACVEMIRQMRRDTFWKHLVPDEEPGVVGVLLAHRLMTNSQSCLYVAESGGELIGMCGGEITSHFLSPHVPILHEWAWWVRSESRHALVGGQLWHAVRVWGCAQGARVEFRVRSKSRPNDGDVLGTEVYTVKEIAP